MHISTKVTLWSFATVAACSQASNGSDTQATGGGNSTNPSEAHAAQPEGGTLAGSSAVPPPLASRLQELNSCKSRLHDTQATQSVQSIQGKDGPALLYGYYLIDQTGVSDPFTSKVQGFNEQCKLPANAAIGSIRAVLEAKPGAVVDATDPRSLVDIFTDVCGLLVINNESGWYEGWLISDVRVPDTHPPGQDGHAPFGFITQADADALAKLGTGNDAAGNLLTVDGNIAHGPSNQPASGSSSATNVVAVPVSLGTWNALQGEDAHAYWELNEFTNFTFPLYELPGTAGLSGTFETGQQYAPLGGIGPNVDSRIAGSGPSGVINNTGAQRKAAFGDNPQRPRDPDRTPTTCAMGQAGVDGGEESTQEEKVLRFIPSGLAREILLDVHARIASFESNITDPGQRYVDADAFEVAKLDANHDGVLQFKEVGIKDSSQGLPNTRLYIAPNEFNRVAITREINDGLLAPRFAPTQQAYVLSGAGAFVPVSAPAMDGGADAQVNDGGASSDVAARDAVAAFDASAADAAAADGATAMDAATANDAGAGEAAAQGDASSSTDGTTSDDGAFAMDVGTE
jgi:hypothetical protein